MISFNLPWTTGILARLRGFEPGFVAASPASSNPSLFRFVVRFADVFSPIAEPFGDLPTKCEPLSILSSRCRLFRLLINLFGHLVTILAPLERIARQTRGFPIQSAPATETPVAVFDDVAGKAIEFVVAGAALA
jgi:hypothetical protein